MLQLAFSIGLIVVLGAMLPGPDFAIITANSLQGGRRAGVATACGISTALLIHITYCSLGLALVIMHRPALFLILKILAAIYLAWLGLKLICQTSRSTTPAVSSSKDTHTVQQAQQNSAQLQTQPTNLSWWRAYSRGFWTNALNPKALFFILTLFSMVAAHPLSLWQRIFLAAECSILTWLWFSSLSWMLTHKKLLNGFLRRQQIIMRLLGIIILLFAVALYAVHPASRQTLPSHAIATAPTAHNHA